MNITNFSESLDVIEIITGVVAHDPISVARMATILSDKTFTAIQKIPYMQIDKYLKGIKQVEEDFGGACKISEKLFSDPEKKNENAMRIYKMVTSTDTERKIDYLIDATRSMLLGLISINDMFRIFRAVVDSLPEDLEYLSTIVEKSGPFTGNTQILALSRSGLMISAGIDADADVEEQQYHVSTLGFMVDKYALSLSNERRQKMENAGNRKFIGPMTTSDDRIMAMIEEQKQEIIDSVQPKWESFNPNMQFEKIQQISQKREAVTLLIYATKTDGVIFKIQDITHQYPYVQIGDYVIPEEDDPRKSAAWVGAIKTLEDTGMLECVNSRHRMYRLTDVGWREAETFIEQNDLKDSEITNPNELLKLLE